MRYVQQQFFMIVLGLFSMSAHADFCAVNNFGTISTCFLTLDMCRSWVSGSGGGCVFRGNAPQPQQLPTLWDSIKESVEQNRREEQAQQEAQEQLQRERASVYPKLLPLVTVDTSLSKESESIILSTLQRALEMDAGSSRREWRNNNVGSSGEVTVDTESQNRYGDTCRDFRISLNVSGQPTHTVEGTACRKNGRWVWL